MGNNSITLSSALYLSNPEVTALVDGDTVVIASPFFMRPTQRGFALVSADLPSTISPEDYTGKYSAIAKQDALKHQLISSFKTRSWAFCTQCKAIKNPEELKTISRITIWNFSFFQKILETKPCIFLAFLRTYKTSEQSVKLSQDVNGKNGRFVALSEPIEVDMSRPVLNDKKFNLACRKIKELREAEINKFEFASETTVEVPSSLAQEPGSNSVGLSHPTIESQNIINRVLPRLPFNNRGGAGANAWISKIAEVGNSSNGNDFEKLVRKSFLELGFSCSNNNPKANLDPNKVGGSGGVDFYCESPYPIVGECKSTKTTTIPSGTPGQLIKLGHNNLQEKYQECIKLIVAAGNLSNPASQTLKQNNIGMMSPEALQRIVEFRNKYKSYPGALDLFELRDSCFLDDQQKQFGGPIDSKIEEYLLKLEKAMELKFNLVLFLHEYYQKKKKYLFSSSPRTFFSCEAFDIYTEYQERYEMPITQEEMREALIELSSPFVGCLGRITNPDPLKESYYWLRDLEV